MSGTPSAGIDITPLSLLIVTLTGLVGIPVVASKPPAAVLIVSRSLREIITSTPGVWPAVLITIGTEQLGTQVKLSMITAVAPAAKPLLHLSVKVVVPRSIKTILPATCAALVSAGAFALFGTA